MGKCFNGILVEKLACTCAPQCGHISSDNYHCHIYTALKEIRTCSFMNPGTVALHFAFPYTNWRRKICFCAEFSSEANQCNA